MQPTYKQLKNHLNEIQDSPSISEDLKTNLVADEIYKYFLSGIKELESIANNSRTLNGKIEAKKQFIESFLSGRNPEFIIIESEINKL